MLAFSFNIWHVFVQFFLLTVAVLKSQELRYVHEELIKQKTAFQSRLQDRDGEISRLRNQVLFACCALYYVESWPQVL